MEQAFLDTFWGATAAPRVLESFRRMQARRAQRSGAAAFPGVAGGLGTARMRARRCSCRAQNCACLGLLPRWPNHTTLMGAAACTTHLPAERRRGSTL